MLDLLTMLYLAIMIFFTVDLISTICMKSAYKYPKVYIYELFGVPLAWAIYIVYLH